MHPSVCDPDRPDPGTLPEPYAAIRRGSVLVLAPVLIVALLAVSLLVVEWGRIQVAQAELQTAADAAAMAAASALGTRGSDPSELALGAAAENRVLGKPVTLVSSQDVTYGNWDSTTGTFQERTGDPWLADAVRVVARRSSSRGEGVKLLIGQVLGSEGMDLKAEAIAFRESLHSGFVGIDYVRIEGVVRIDSYVAADGSYGSGRRDNAKVMSNGPITITGNVRIGGDVRPGPGQTATGGSVAGLRQSLVRAIEWQDVHASEYAGYDNGPISHLLSGGNLSLAGAGTISLPPGKYLVRDLSLAGVARLHAQGPVQIFVTGIVQMTGGATVSTGAPADLEIRVLGSGPVLLSGTSNYYGHIYAPKSPVTITGTFDFFGSAVGKSMQMSGTTDIHHDESPRGGARSSLVR